MSRLRTHLVVAAFAAFTATATTALVAGPAVADRTGGYGRGEIAQLRTDLAYFEAANLEMTRGLERVEAAGQRSSDPRTRASIQRIVDETRRRAGRFIDDDGPGARPGPIDTAPSYPSLSSADFDRLVARVRGTMSTSDAVEVVRSAARASYFTVDQALVLLKACGFESARIDMAVALYPHILDKNRWFLIDEAFDYSTSRATLRSRITQIDGQQGATP